MPKAGNRPPNPLLLLFQECPLLQFLERLPELLLGVHDDRAVPGHGLLERLSRDEEEPDSVVSGLYFELIAPIEENQRTIVRLRRRRRVQPPDSFRRHGERTRRIAELPSACEHVRKSVPGGLYRKGSPAPRRHRHVKINRVSRDSIDGARLSPKASAHDSNMGTIVVFHLWNIDCLHLLVARRRHFEGRRKVRP